MLQRPVRELLTHDGKPARWESWFPPDLPADHKPFFEYVTDQFGVEWCFWYDPHEAFRWVNFSSEYIVFIEGEETIAGKPMDLLDWQLGPTREMFGWKVVRDGVPTDDRRYHTANVWVPKKNSKTTWGVALALAAMKLDNHQSAQCFYCAAIDDQAEKTGWRIVREMVLSDKAKLKEEYTAFEEKIEHGPSNSTLWKITSSAEGKAGINTKFGVIDEWWEYKKDDVEIQLITAMANQRNPFLLKISTCGNDVTVPAHVDYVSDKELLEGKRVDVRHLSIIHGADPDDDPNDPATWAKANPAWGVTVNAETIRRIWEKMQGTEAKKAAFAQNHCGIWVSGAQEYITDKQWRNCFEDYKEEDLLGQFCCAAIDLAANRDMNALTLQFPMWHPTKEGVVIFKRLDYLWVPDITAKEKAANDRRYENWIAQGYLFRTPGNTVDYREIRRFVSKELAKKFKIHQIGYDKRFANNVIFDWQDDEEFRIWTDEQIKEEPNRLVEIHQGEAGMGIALRESQTATLNREALHNGNPIVDWHRGNVRVVLTRNGVEMLNKMKSTGKIDSMASGAMAFYLAQKVGPPKDQTDVYAERGLFIL